MPNALIKLVFPTAFVPYNNIPSVFSNPIEISLATYNSVCWIFSIKQCLKSSAFIKYFPVSFETISGLQ